MREGYRLSDSDGRAKGMEIPETVEDLADILLDQAYLADRGLATSTFLALCLGRPLLLEGEAGVGKTELAKAIASAFNLQPIRLQCYEGIDANQALYEWDYTRQLLYVRSWSARSRSSGPGLPRCPRSSLGRCPRRSRTSARWTSPNAPASPRRSTGHGRSTSSAPTGWTPT